MDTVGLGEGGVLQPLVAVSADGTEVLRCISSSFGFVFDVAKGESDRASGAERVGIARSSTAHLTGVAVALQHPSACSLGDAAFEGRDALVSFEEVLVNLQVCAAFVGQDLIAVLVR